MTSSLSRFGFEGQQTREGGVRPGRSQQRVEASRGSHNLDGSDFSMVLVWCRTDNSTGPLEGVHVQHPQDDAEGTVP